MRSNDDVYWTTSLPKDHEALQELDAYCAEWGGLTRAEATRRLLIEWVKVRKGSPSLAGGHVAPLSWRRLFPLQEQEEWQGRARNHLSRTGPLEQQARFLMSRQLLQVRAYMESDQ